MLARIAACLWASPNTAIGLVFAVLFVAAGAQGRLHSGVLEVAGGWLGRAIRAPRLRCPFRAITLGHVVLATDEAALEASRAHERVHVRQYERWGPFFLPAYAASSAWQLICGRGCYRDNYFEREASTASATRR